MRRGPLWEGAGGEVGGEEEEKEEGRPRLFVCPGAKWLRLPPPLPAPKGAPHLCWRRVTGGGGGKKGWTDGRMDRQTGGSGLGGSTLRCVCVWGVMGPAPPPPGFPFWGLAAGTAPRPWDVGG